ncbi:Amino acid transporter AVT1C [Nymphon striatum]|nr:Amino acid transporter AVT1C [Nymphon striatum]
MQQLSTSIPSYHGSIITSDPILMELTVLNVNSGSEEDELLQKDRTSKKEISVGMVFLLVTGELMGAGILALPYAVVTSGYFGVILIVVIGLLSSYGGVKLGRCWQIIIERWPQYDTNIKDPFPVIGYICFGKCAKEFVRLNVYLMLYGCDVVILLLSSQLVQSLTTTYPISYCNWILIIGLCLMPTTWLESPKDFWQAGVAAFLATAISMVIVSVQLVGDLLVKNINDTVKPEINVQAVMFTYGTIAFMNGGSATFPTIQNDMKDKKKFSFTYGMASIVINGVYLVLGVLSFLILSKETKPNILDTLPLNWSTKIAQVLIIIHLFVVFCVLLNPVLQDLENVFNIPFKFCWQRVLIRSSIVLSIIFVAESVPNFGNILNIIGASSVTLLSFVFPSVFYFKLVSMNAPPGEVWPKWVIPWYEKAFILFLITFTVAGGLSSTYLSVKQMVSTNTFVMPCYFRTWTHI